MLWPREMARPILYLSTTLLFITTLISALPSATQCRCFPTDECWPTAWQWNEFNRTVQGRLIATKPIASFCHKNQGFEPYDPEKCNSLKSAWELPETHYQTSSSIMAPFFANQSCDPFLPPDSQCVLGTYVQYAVDARDAADYQRTIEFTRSHNIRLVIRNTGHDYLGKSTGAGAVAVWTHHLKDIKILDYHSRRYTGKATKIGAGVQTFEANEAAHAHGLAIVAGSCPSIGLAGGFTQGGGHGQLSSKYGLAADQVLEWEVVTATGEHLIATPEKNADLYWALSGGGGGTYALVLSMTSKIYTEPSAATANLTFTNEGVSQDTFYGIVETFIDHLIPLIDAQGSSAWFLTNTTFSMTPTTLPGGTRKELNKLLSPVLSKLEENNMPYTYYINEFPSYYSSYQAMTPACTITELLLGGRLIPRRVMERNANELVQRFRIINEYGAIVSGISVNVAEHRHRHRPSNNAVNPAWREAATDIVIGMPFSYTDWAFNLDNQKLITDTLIPQLKEITPGGGTYLNEADSNEPDWQHAFYGNKYATLMKVKEKYDPEHLLFALTGVGSEDWVQRGDGRLCRS